MTEREVPFLEELREELRRAAQRSAGSGARSARGWRLNAFQVAVPVLAALAALAYVVVAGLGSGSPHRPPVNDFTAGASYNPSTTRPKLVGAPVCVRMIRDRHVAPLVHSDAAPDPGLTSELAMLREPATPVDSTPLGHWDRFMASPQGAGVVTTVFQRYVRVFTGPRDVKLAVLPVIYCSGSQTSGNALPDRPVFRETLRQALAMLVLSNPGDHPAVFVGNARQIRNGPGLAGLDASHQPGWIQAVVVPDGVSRVLMKFTPPFLHHYTNTVATPSNVGIVVRNPPYTPTTVIWYGPTGKVIKRFVYGREIATDRCLAEHKKTCFGPVSRPTPGSVNPPLTAPAEPAARALYQPIIAFARATTSAQRAHWRLGAQRVASRANRCDAPYSKQLFTLNLVSRSPAMRRRVKVNTLWQHASMMETYEADMASMAPQLKQLAAAWARLSVKNQPINEFAHAMAAEINATLNAPAISTCRLVHALAAHHFSYGWARQSSYWAQATRWWRQVSSAGSRTGAFWRYVQRPLFGGSGGAGQNLFTQAQLAALSNLPGELG